MKHITIKTTHLLNKILIMLIRFKRNQLILSQNNANLILRGIKLINNLDLFKIFNRIDNLITEKITGSQPHNP